MSGLLLCREKRAKHPYPVPELGISLYSPEELCYYIYHYLFLLKTDFIGEDLLHFIGTELDLPELEGKIRRWSAGNSDMGQILIMILQDIHYYSEAELVAFREQLDWLRKAKPSERAKKKADFLLETKKYAAALEAYEQIEAGEQDGGINREFMGALYHNMGMACIGLFDGSRALDCLKKACRYREEEELLREIAMLCNMEGLEFPGELEEKATAQQRMKWKEEYDTFCTHLRYAGKAKAVGDLWETDSLRRKAGVTKLLNGWKKEYREMTAL